MVATKRALRCPLGGLTTTEAGGTAALGATLADAHAAVLDLIELDAAVGRESSTLDDAAVQLEELRVAYAAHLKLTRP